ncbi:MAG: hypothetical protein JO223_25845 [Hyphomicrobiales bacterium]|nr:hypothetical protein [Hyphomicrobiales bacterium]MBV8441039.1 hypothetical protein [Hyphomicrobiales bacterium]
MSDRLTGVILLPRDGPSAGPPVDIALADGRIAADQAAQSSAHEPAEAATLRHSG